MRGTETPLELVVPTGGRGSEGAPGRGGQAPWRGDAGEAAHHAPGLLCVPFLRSTLTPGGHSFLRCEDSIWTPWAGVAREVSQQLPGARAAAQTTILLLRSPCVRVPTEQAGPACHQLGCHSAAWTSVQVYVKALGSASSENNGGFTCLLCANSALRLLSTQEGIPLRAINREGSGGRGSRLPTATPGCPPISKVTDC